MTSYNIEQVRQDFPILAQTVHDKPLVYLDNAATTQKPLAVIDALDHYYRCDNANVHRGLHTLSERATLAYENARTTIRYFINAAQREEIIFCRGTTEAINMVAQSYVRPRIQAGETILLTHMEHHSNIVPWQMVAKQTGCRLAVIPVTDEGELDLTAAEKLLAEEPKVLAIGHVSNALGTINPLKQLIAKAREYDVLVVVDGAQAGPHCSIDVQDLDCDFYALSGHKMYGPTGIGVLYGKHHLLERMAPYQGGGEMIAQVSFEQTTYAKLPNKFEAGTPHIAGAIGLAKAIDYLNQLGMDAIAEHESELLAYALERMQSVNGVILVGAAKDRAAVLSFNLRKVHAHDVGTILSSMGIAIRAGHHCAMPLMDRFSVAATARASFGLYNTREDVDAFIDALHKVREVFG